VPAPIRSLARCALLSAVILAAPALAAPPAARAPAERLGPARLATARAALQARAAAWGLRPDEAGAAEVAGLHDPGEGPVVATWRRPVAGVEVLGEQAAVVLDRRGAAVATLGALSPLRPAPGARFAVPAAEAAARALAAITGATAAAADLAAAGTAGPWTGLSVRPSASAARPALAGATARARRFWQPADGALRPIWAVEVEAPRQAEPEARLQLALVSAQDGAVLSLRTLVRREAFAWRVWAEPAAPWRPADGPTGFAGTPHPTGLPDGFQPPRLAQSLVALDHAGLSTGDPWLPPGATETIGNNAIVYADVDGIDGYTPPADTRGRVSGPGAFDWTADLEADPTTEANRQAALAHAFYTVNFLHDWFYDAGFDEAAGNMQADNFGRGGLGADPLLVELQDPTLPNNAMMLSRADGAPPRMVVGLYGAITARYVAWVSPTPEAAGRPVREEATRSAFGPAQFDLSAEVVAVDDGAGNGSDACDDGAWRSDVTGRIALVDAAGCRSPATAACGCSAKARLAQARGAAGILYVNDQAGFLFLSLEAADPEVAIPALGLTSAVGAAFRSALAGGPVTARMVRGPPRPRRDGALDTLIVAHEWGHALSARLVGNNVGLGTQQSLALGEGWGDFVAMLLAVRQEDADADAAAPAGLPPFGGVYASSSWTLGGDEGLFGGPNQAWYFGTRRVPYSTDFTRNALTLRHIVTAEPLPLATPGGAAIPFADNGLGNAEVHNAGEVWATMLWECYAALLRDTTGAAPRLSFGEAQARMKRYLVASLAGTPLSPTFLDARDALVAAAMAGDPADGARFWQAFARRGAGEGASCGAFSSPDNGPVVESFVSPFPEPEPPPPPPPPTAGSPGDVGGCQSGGAGALALLGVAALFLRLRRR